MLVNMLTDDIATDLVKGTIGHGASKEAIQQCKEDMLKRPYVLWYSCLNHYKELFGYTSKEDEKPIGFVGLFPILNC